MAIPNIILKCNPHSWYCIFLMFVLSFTYLFVNFVTNQAIKVYFRTLILQHLVFRTRAGIVLKLTVKVLVQNISHTAIEVMRNFIQIIMTQMCLTI